jgi:hypothetical protein
MVRNVRVTPAFIPDPLSKNKGDTIVLRDFSKAIALSGMILLTGCGTIYMTAPAGSNVRALTKNAPTAARVEKKVWFKWWGKDPLNEADVDSATIIEQERLAEARIRMTNTLADGIVTAVTGIVGFPRRTLIVEGNRERTEGTSSGAEAFEGGSIGAAAKRSGAQRHEQNDKKEE